MQSSYMCVHFHMLINNKVSYCITCLHAGSTVAKSSQMQSTSHRGSPKHTLSPWLCVSVYSLLTCVEPPPCRARAACHCLGSVMDVPFVAHTHTDRQTDRQWRGSAWPSCPPEDEFLLCLGKRMWSHSLKIQPMSLATHDLIQASPLCRAPSPSPLLLLLSLALSVSSCIFSVCLSVSLSVFFTFFICWIMWKKIVSLGVTYKAHARWRCCVPMQQIHQNQTYFRYLDSSIYLLPAQRHVIISKLLLQHDNDPKYTTSLKVSSETKIGKFCNRSNRFLLISREKGKISVEILHQWFPNSDHFLLEDFESALCDSLPSSAASTCDIIETIKPSAWFWSVENIDCM